MNFDRDRGCLIRKHPTGFRIGMYIDRPGVFYDEIGNAVTPELAKAAGFDVAKAKKDAALLNRRAEALRMVESEFATAEQNIMDAINSELGIQIKETSTGRYSLFDETGRRLTTARDMLWEEAVVLYEGITGKDVVRSAADAPDLDSVLPGPDTAAGRTMMGEVKPKPKPSHKKKSAQPVPVANDTTPLDEGALLAEAEALAKESDAGK